MECQEIAATKRWLQDMVIGLNLCPFAKKPWQRKQIRFSICTAAQEDHWFSALAEELNFLLNATDTETTLLLLPALDRDFYRFLDVIDQADFLIGEAKLRGEVQLAHFHPLYEFAGEAPEACSHYTNRAPHAILHLIKEDSITRVLDTYPDPESIPTNNMQTMERLGLAKLKSLLNSYKTGA
ncbi:MAG: DUF1415 domain-containing protein [Aestuariibacter sp.]